ncbi:MAG: bifunctional adenosylcobinamide kinase/adenosylcobinamide-phosphate guanylyltransferase [Nitrospiraceae bacterium]
MGPVRRIRKKVRQGKLLLVVGGASSGKSDVALSLAGKSGKRAFVATGQPLDEEMAERIGRHQRVRPSDWVTAEIPIDLSAWFEKYGGQYGAIVVDCLTLWQSNLCEAGMAEGLISAKVDELLRMMRLTSATIVVVSNELGMGLVPVDRFSRAFRELAGRVNQQVAAEADEVYAVMCGQALRLK